LTKPSIKAVETLRETDLMIIDGAEQQQKNRLDESYQGVPGQSANIRG
jgi:hypothetical protein